MSNLPEWIKLSCERIEPVGSRITCSPAPTDTDEDWLCLLYPNMDVQGFYEALDTDGWAHSSYDTQASDFSSYKKGELNVLVITDPVYFEKFMTATKLAKQFNLLKKEDRVALFQAILYQNEVKKTKKKYYASAQSLWATGQEVQEPNVPSTLGEQQMATVMVNGG